MPLEIRRDDDKGKKGRSEEDEDKHPFSGKSVEYTPEEKLSVKRSTRLPPIYRSKDKSDKKEKSSKYEKWVDVPGFKGSFMRFWHHESFWIGLFRDILVALMLLGLLALCLYLYSSTWPPMVSVEGNSMYPHMYEGDMVFLQGLSRSDVITHEDGQISGYMTYEDYGDVIVYRPYGDESRQPIIHRAMYWVDPGEPMWEGGVPAPWGGYITLGDNNDGRIDQWGIIYNQPVPPEWIQGVCKFSIPWLGNLRLLF